ncbi:hypothetical protein Vadar_004749 [Vaccinium darrowii]|uniref:Uncharacterized protein n=1 Tax=Vaccinium darrowii TaxID=229202 RepID=A0ACB7WXX9_9ERIC|nr:hypothetical protein Vadar_004749 [Vaccinium darrowii]
MVDAVVSFVVERLGDLLIEQVVFLQGVKDDVVWLRDKLEYLLCFLKDAEEKQDLDNRMRKWISDMRDVAYEAEDIIDDFILKVEAGTTKKMGLKDCFEKYFCICSKNACLVQQANLYGIGREINKLKTKITEIQQNKETFNIRSIDFAREGSDRQNTIDNWLRKGRQYEDNVHVVGFKEDADKLMFELVKEVKDRYVISIVGTGGLGKTTIARKLYSTLSTTTKFECYGWVSVSKDYKIQDLLRSTIKSFNRPTTIEELEFLEKMKEEDLELYLRDYLKGHRYLVVLDDVWDVNAWPSLKRAFPDENNGSRVIMTTRHKVVAKPCDVRTYVHELPFLKDEESWELFCSKAFPKYDDEVGNNKSRCPQHLVSLAREMASKCHGLPLAIVVLGGLLCGKDPDEWTKLKEYIWRHRFVSLDHSDMRLRTLLFFGGEDKNMEIAQLQSLCRKLRLLRVLDVHCDSSFSDRKTEERLSDEIGKLIHLRYLGVSGTIIEALSQFIGNLHTLQTLELDESKRLPIQLPKEVCKAEQLRHLIGYFKWSSRVDNLQNLRTLRTVVVEDQVEFNPMGLINLRELGVHYVSEGDNRLITLDSIGGLRSLQSLRVGVSEQTGNLEVHLHPLSHCQHLVQLSLLTNSQTILKLPTEVLPNLKYLLISEGRFTEDPMPMLEKLPKLTVLVMLWCHLTELVYSSAGGFPQLQILQIVWCVMNQFQVEEGGMPVLKGLLIEGECDLSIPDRLRTIPAPQPPISAYEWAY